MSRRAIVAMLVWAAACRPERGVVDKDDSDVVVETDAGACGDGVVDPGEGCDLGEANADDGNCSTACVAAPVQRVTVSLEEVAEVSGLRAEGVEDASAPAGLGAWAPPEPAGDDSDVSLKFEIYLPHYDVASELTAEQLALLDDAPWRPPASWTTETVRLSDIAEVSFWTSTPATESTSPFYLVLYTARDGVEDGGWFGYRLHALPQAAVGVEAAGEA